MNKTDLLLQMMEQPQHYTAEEWQEILADEECREIYTLLSKTQSAIDAARADQEVTDDMIDAEWKRLSCEKREVKSRPGSLRTWVVAVRVCQGRSFHRTTFSRLNFEPPSFGLTSRRSCAVCRTPLPLSRNRSRVFPCRSDRPLKIE